MAGTDRHALDYARRLQCPMREMDERNHRNCNGWNVLLAGKIALTSAVSTKVSSRPARFFPDTQPWRQCRAAEVNR